MTFKQTRLVTYDVAKLTRFYESATKAKAQVVTDGYAEFDNEPCKGLAIADPAKIRLYGAGVVDRAR